MRSFNWKEVRLLSNLEIPMPPPIICSDSIMKQSAWASGAATSILLSNNFSIHAPLKSGHCEQSSEGKGRIACLLLIPFPPIVIVSKCVRMRNLLYGPPYKQTWLLLSTAPQVSVLMKQCGEMTQVSTCKSPECMTLTTTVCPYEPFCGCSCWLSLRAGVSTQMCTMDVRDNTR